MKCVCGCMHAILIEKPVSLEVTFLIAKSCLPIAQSIEVASAHCVFARIWESYVELEAFVHILQFSMCFRCCRFGSRSSGSSYNWVLVCFDWYKYSDILKSNGGIILDLCSTVKAKAMRVQLLKLYYQTKQFWTSTLPLSATTSLFTVGYNFWSLWHFILTSLHLWACPPGWHHEPDSRCLEDIAKFISETISLVAEAINPSRASAIWARPLWTSFLSCTQQ